jgi:hypothetical protein
VVAVGFLRLLLTVLFIAMGVVGLMLTLVVYYSATWTLEAVLTVMLSLGMILAGYGLYAGAKWGWLLAVAFTVLNIVASYIESNTFALALHAAILIMLLVVAKQYRVPVPGARVLKATIYVSEIEGEFVKRKN